MKPFEYLYEECNKEKLRYIIVDRCEDGHLLVFFSTTDWVVEQTQYLFRVKLLK